MTLSRKWNRCTARSAKPPSRPRSEIRAFAKDSPVHLLQPQLGCDTIDEKRTGDALAIVGTFLVRYRIENVVDRTKSAVLSKMLVDTSSEYTSIPAATLERLGI